ncbi:MAG: hypothetical protein H3C51_08105 [Rubellimicrobium sp.]|nr:hypothetical protein [Rubellimicrobium sp.]
MRRALFLSPLALAACALPEAVPDPALVARQEAACTAAIAQHVRRPESAVTARFLSEAGGIATVETLDGDRRHLCMVDAGGRVIDYRHPDA